MIYIALYIAAYCLVGKRAQNIGIANTQYQKATDVQNIPLEQQNISCEIGNRLLQRLRRCGGVDDSGEDVESVSGLCGCSGGGAVDSTTCVKHDP